MYDNPTTLTHSKIAQASCLARYHKIHVLGLQDTSDPARRGSTVHTANELYVTALMEAGEPSDSDLARECLQSAIALEHTPAHLVPDCEYLWANWTERFELNLGAFLEAEKRRIVGPYSFKPDLAYAYPDRLELGDIKTQYQALTQDGAKRDLQARMYAWLASRVWPGFSIYRFVFHFVRLNQTVSVDLGPSDMDAIERQLAAHEEGLALAQEQDEWPAMPGQQCQYCSFACPLVDDASRLPMRLQTAQEAAQVASETLVLEQALAAKLRVLESYTALQGPVEAGGYEWAHRPTETMKFPAAGVIDVLRAKEVDVSKLTVGKTAIKGYLTARKWAHVTPLLEALAVITKGTKFSAKKAGVVGDDEGEETV